MEKTPYVKLRDSVFRLFVADRIVHKILQEVNVAKERRCVIWSQVHHTKEQNIMHEEINPKYN
jgi:hypothetical protein